MNSKNVIKLTNIEKTYKGFELDVKNLEIPKGFATALVGENGAGKTTMIDIIAGINLNYNGDIELLGQYSGEDREKKPEVKNKIGYTGTGNYFFPSWTIQQVKEIQKLLFTGFDEKKFEEIIKELAVFPQGNIDMSKKISDLSDGNKTKIMLAGVLARDTDMLLLDEPASPLDPLMRDKLCEMIRDYLLREEGEKSVIFSTHNIADMESVTDYAIIVEHGEVVEQGFVEDLKEKYIVVKGEKADEEAAKKVLYSMSANSFGFEGICLSSRLDELAGMDIACETPTLSQICVAVMKNNSKLY